MSQNGISSIESVPRAKILIIDDEKGIVQLCERLLVRAGFEVFTSLTPEDGLKYLHHQAVNLLMVDIRMPGMDGFKVLELARQRQPDLAVLMITGYGTMETAIEALRRGADGLSLKPFTASELIQSVERALEQNKLKREMSRLQALRPLFELSARLFAETSPSRLRRLLTQVACQILNAEAALLFEWRRTARQTARRTAEHSSVVLRSSAGYTGSEIEDGPAQALAAAVQPFVQQAGETGLPVTGRVQVELPAGSVLPVGAPAAEQAIAEPTSGCTLPVGAPAGQSTPRRGAMILCAPAPLHTRHLTVSRQDKQNQKRTSAGQSTAGQSTAGQIVLVVLRSARAAEINAADEELLVILIRQAAAALENAFLAGELRNHIHQLEQSQRMLVQAEKMAAAGRLMASIAHEINNPLQAMQNCLHLARRSEIDTDTRQEYLEMTQSELERLMKTVRGMLDFYRPAALENEATDIHAILQKVLLLLQQQFTKNQVTIHTSLDPNLPQIPAIADQIQQVFLNLILNAIEAMPEGGRLNITTRYLSNTRRPTARGAPRRGAPPPVGAPGGEIEIVFLDSGPGIPAKVRNHIFEPFNSTKAGGTGLGLSISYGIIAAHGGTLELLDKRKLATLLKLASLQQRGPAVLSPQGRPAVLCPAAPEVKGTSEPLPTGACFRIRLPGVDRIIEPEEDIHDSSC